MAYAFLRRIIGAAFFDVATYEEVEADASATPQALAVIVLSSLAAGIGVRGMTGGAATLLFFAWASVLALMAWAAFALVTYQIGARLMGTSETRGDVGELLRTLGFAASPGLIQVFGFVPGLTMPVFVAAIVWTVAATVVAIRQALDFNSTGRAAAVCIFAWALSLTVAFAIGLLFGPTLTGTGGI
jgi:hypothetical protein